MTSAALVRDALAWLDERETDMVATLRDWVEIGSFTDDRDGANRCGDALVEAFSSLPLAVERTESQRFGDHLVFSSRAPGPPILLVGHLDTVFPPGTFEGFRRDGALGRGPGALDMKGGLVVILMALRALELALDTLPVRVVVVSDEEVGSPEGRAVIERHAGGARAALVFESGRAGDEIVTDRKGTGAVRVTAAGVAAHAGNAHESGVNAIWALSAFVCEAQRLTDYAKGLTVNVGRIAGGRTKNTVPDEASCELDFRFVHPDEGVGLERALVAAALAAEARVPGSKVTVHGGVARAPLVRTRESEALATAYGAHAAAEGLGHALATRQGGGSDASTTSALGIASIDALGPRGKGFHTLDEQVELATLVPKAKALARFLAAAPRTH